jgi:hypothetical protein
VGSLAGKRFLAAIEPWHGNQVSIYRMLEGKWARQVIEDKISDGHALLTADLNGDRRDEVLAGFRGPGGSVYLYTAADAAGERWTRATLDDAMSAAACTAVDLNGDGRIDIACIDSTRLKWYENRGAAAPSGTPRP